MPLQDHRFYLNRTPEDGLLKDGRTTLFKMNGNSMYPVLKDGDVGMVQNTILSVIQGVAPFLLIVCIKLLVDRLTSPGSIALSWMSQTGLIILTAFTFLLSGALSVKMSSSSGFN